MTIISTSRRVTPATGEPGEFITPDVCDASPAFTDHMFSMVYSPEAGWLKPQLLPLEPLSLHPATSALYNGQFVFEDVTAHRRVDGSIAVFRPWDHARRLRQSASRLAMPELPDDLFVAAVEELLEADGTRLTPPTDVNGAGSPTAASATLHLRALMFGTDVLPAPLPADHFRFVVTASPMSGASTVTANRAADDMTDGIAV
ncbi:MAG: hypothetical protein ACRDVE_00625, partial [Actinocrinis sp.]